ncbi:SDR family oxidoreductase [Nonomuraea sp. NPDC049158]|uniref:SDR family NAD(P)-dependent oxidoreductase n=1 Tax=Nonomuraea sp. NPDC049158 TaxID=3155649 RepID=UPI0033DB2D84
MSSTQDSGYGGRHVLVTGGGTGIGRAVALEAARRDAAAVLVVGRRLEPLLSVAAGHPAIVPVVADVTTGEGADTIARAVRSGPGTLDVLVHNAAVNTRLPIDSLRMAEVRAIFETNVFGPIQLTQRLLPDLRSPGATIVLVSSVVGHRPPPPGTAVYAASKAAVESLTRAWAIELAYLGIRVNAVAPGVVDSQDAPREGFTAEQVRVATEMFAAATVQGRPGRAEEIATWVLHLGTPGEGYVTGQVLSVDGGLELNGMPRRLEGAQAVIGR